MTVMRNLGKKLDRRTSRTQSSLRGALIELILEKPYDTITVQNIIDRADVGRSTFYAHYRDKDHLFLHDIERVLDGFVQHIEWRNIRGGRCVPIKELFCHVQEFHHFFKALTKSRKNDWFYRCGLNSLDHSIKNTLTHLLADKSLPSVPIPVVSIYLAGGIVDLLRWWVDHHMPYSPEHMDDIFHQLVMPGFRTALGGNEAGVNIR
jgi:AcrR family transcriptional regulator